MVKESNSTMVQFTENFPNIQLNLQPPEKSQQMLLKSDQIIKKREWNVQASKFSMNTSNPIRAIVEHLNIQPNADKSFIPLSVGKHINLKCIIKQSAILWTHKKNKQSFWHERQICESRDEAEISEIDLGLKSRKIFVYIITILIYNKITSFEQRRKKPHPKTGRRAVVRAMRQDNGNYRIFSPFYYLYKLYDFSTTM